MLYIMYHRVNRLDHSPDRNGRPYYYDQPRFDKTRQKLIKNQHNLSIFQ